MPPTAVPGTVPTRFHDALQPISEAAPAGAFLADEGPVLGPLQELRNDIDVKLAEWLADEQGRVPNTAPGAADQGDEAIQLGAINARWFERRAGAAHRRDWLDLQQRVGDALAHESKDLRLLIRLVEASVYAEGFRGLADALALAARLIAQFWENLHPNPNDVEIQDGHDPRPGIVAWLNDAKDGLPFVVTTIPLSDAPDGPQATLRHLLVAPKHWLGWPTEDEVRTALQRTAPPSLRATLEDLQRCLAECRQLDAALSARLEQTNLVKLRERLQQCAMLVQESLTSATLRSGPPPDAVASNSAPPTLIDRLRRLQGESPKAVTARERFLAHIAAAEACVEADLYWVAAPFIESALRTVEEHKLAGWEQPEIMSRITRVVEGCRSAAQAQGDVLQLEWLAGRKP
jgi:ImpA, N-terminal, type VI secretion system/Type VI secretion, EvfE, EvfF, ImpA, BimE, VC_A0119, VasJ